MAIEILLTGAVTSAATDGERGSIPVVKVTLEARDASGRQVNVVCSTPNEKLAGSLRLMEVGQCAAVRGHARVPLNNKKGSRVPSIDVFVTDVIILN
jgi:hypothetical protein